MLPSRCRSPFSASRGIAAVVDPPIILDPTPELLIRVPSRDAALLQFRRHIINRLALALLADQRLEFVTAPRLSTDPTRPPQHAPAFGPRPDLYDVRVDSLAVQLPGVCFETDPLRLTVWAHPEMLPNASTRLSLAAFQGRGTHDGFQTTSTEPIYRYRPDRGQLRRRDGLSGDVVYLFQLLLVPH